MQVKNFLLKYLKALQIILVFSLAVIIFMVIYFPNYTKLKKLRQTNDKMEEEIQQIREEIKELKNALQKVGTDPYLYEKFARDELGVAKEDEIVIDIEE